MFKKVSIITISILLVAVSVYAAADMSKIDVAGKQILNILFTFAYWGMGAKAIFDTIKLGLSGNTKGAVDKALSYVVLYLLIFFIPWIFDIIKGIFS